MIRDPSDGSVKPPLSPEMLDLLRKEAKKPPGPDLTHEPTRKFFAGEYQSGMPPASAKDSDRHQRSRQWLADYRAGKFKPKSEETT